jgi:hypothetical protein
MGVAASSGAEGERVFLGLMRFRGWWSEGGGAARPQATLTLRFAPTRLSGERSAPPRGQAVRDEAKWHTHITITSSVTSSISVESPLTM